MVRVKAITRKAEWPDWTPPDEMLKRRLICRASCQVARKTLWCKSNVSRLIALPHPWHKRTTYHRHGCFFSCIRMVNDDVMDLYNRVRVGTRVIVI